MRMGIGYFVDAAKAGIDQNSRIAFASIMESQLLRAVECLQVVCEPPHDTSAVGTPVGAWATTVQTVGIAMEL